MSVSSELAQGVSRVNLALGQAECWLGAPLPVTVVAEWEAEALKPGEGAGLSPAIVSVARASRNCKILHREECRGEHAIAGDPTSHFSQLFLP